jgi:hypothetical protein
MTHATRRTRSTAFAAGLGAALIAAAAGPAAGQPATRPATRPAAAAPGAVAAVGPAADAPAVDEAFLQSQRQQRDNARQQYANVPDGGTVPVDQIVLVTDDGDGLLAVEPGPLAPGGGPPAGPTYLRYTAGGSAAGWTVFRSTSVFQNMVRPDGGVGPTAVSNTSVTRIDLASDADTDLWSVRVTQQSTGYTSVYGVSVRGNTLLALYANRRGGAGVVKPGLANVAPVNLTVSESRPVAAGNNPNGFVGGRGFGGMQARSVQVFRATADSVAELRAKYPAEFRRHVVPLLSKVSDLSWLTPGAGDVYAAFREIPADPAVAARLAELLPDLNAAEAGVRDAAADRLTALGPAGVLAALRADVSGLSAEQRGQLGRLVAAHRRRDRPPADPRADPSFLLDALEYPDRAVRSAAKAALEAAVGERLAFDPSLDGPSLGLAADEVRRRVQERLAAGTDPATRPATQPAR